MLFSLVAVFLALVVVTIQGVRTRDRGAYSAFAAIQRPTAVKGVLLTILVVVALLMR